MQADFQGRTVKRHCILEGKKHTEVILFKKKTKKTFQVLMTSYFISVMIFLTPMECFHSRPPHRTNEIKPQLLANTMQKFESTLKMSDYKKEMGKSHTLGTLTRHLMFQTQL